MMGSEEFSWTVSHIHWEGKNSDSQVFTYKCILLLSTPQFGINFHLLLKKRPKQTGEQLVYKPRI